MKNMQIVRQMKNLSKIRIIYFQIPNKFLFFNRTSG